MFRMKVLNYEDAPLRTFVDENGEIWFSGKDTASLLRYANTKDAILTHVDEADRRILQRSEVTTFENSLLKSVFLVKFVPADIPNRGLTIINESGLYALIFGSKLPTATQFKRWVTSEVLPSIRRTGGYGIDNTLSPELQVLIQHERTMQEQQKQLDAVQNKVDAIQEIFSLTPENWKKDVRVAVGKLSMSIAEDYSMMQELYEQIYALLEDRAGADLEARLRNRRKRMEQNGSTKTAVKKITKLDIIEDDKKLKEIFASILREMSAKYV
ncbi:MAG: Bro-N domain-containing protein [Oscillospiraceae bacterium]|nr:Bro-N domain-containing protein [Oscillospiraceae bacterium]